MKPHNQYILTEHLKPIAVVSLLLLGVLLLLFVVHQQLSARIQKATLVQKQQLITSVLPAEVFDQIVSLKGRPLTDPLLGSQTSLVYLATQQGQPSAVVLQVSSNGYNGPVVLLIGILASGAISGLRVLTHQDSSALVGSIEDSSSAWMQTFIGTSLSNPSKPLWRVAKEGGAFDQFAGATITPRALIHSIRDALEYFAQNRTTLLSEQAYE